MRETPESQNSCVLRTRDQMGHAEKGEISVRSVPHATLWKENIGQDLVVSVGERHIRYSNMDAKSKGFIWREDTLMEVCKTQQCNPGQEMIFTRRKRQV